MRKIFFFLCGLTAGVSVSAQISITGTTLSYAQNFNSLDTASTNSSNLPAGWSIKEVGTSTTTVNNQYKGNSGSSNTGETYSYGSTGSTERALGSLASGSNKPGFGVRFMNNTGASINSFTLTYQGEQWRRGTNTSPDSLLFSYSINADSLGDPAATWMNVNALTLTSINLSSPTGVSIDGNLNVTSISGTVNLSVPQGAVLTLKWSDPDVTGSDDGLAIDDLSISFTTGTPPPSYRPNITAVTPTDNAVNVAAATSTVQVVFDRQISLGSGNLTVKNETDQTSQTIVLTAANTSISAYTATITGINLAQAKSYHITFDSTAFDTAGYRSPGIYDTTSWNFSTAAPPPPAATSLNERFDTSCGATPSHLPAGWSEYSVTGAQKWGCNSNGNNASPGVQMNGFSSGNNANEDWLITPQLNLSAMSAVYLRFDHWKRFTGTELQVLLSNNFSGTGDPNLATWTNLNVIASSPADTVTNVWKMYQSNITAYKTQPLHLAFKYTSTISDGYQARLDNVLVTAASTSAGSVDKEKLQLFVSGVASGDQVTFGLNARPGNYSILIRDLAGRTVYTTEIVIGSGEKLKTISGLQLTNGMYFLQVENSHSRAVAKFIAE